MISQKKVHFKNVFLEHKKVSKILLLLYYYYERVFLVIDVRCFRHCCIFYYYNYELLIPRNNIARATKIDSGHLKITLEP